MMSMPNDAIVERWRAGTLEELVSHLLGAGDAPDAGLALQFKDENAQTESAPSEALDTTVDRLRRSLPPEPEGEQFDDYQKTDRSGLTDATSEYWWAFREEGQFGSHPQHDDYSDEGAP
jgi:hypothetical protein